MKPKMSSFLRTISDRFTPTTSQTNLTSDRKARPDGFYTAKTTEALFPKTQAEVDGEECLHDCESCSVKLPRSFKIDEDDKLYGEIKGWSRHLVVATGKTDWVRDVEDEKGSVMQAIGKHGDEVEGGRLMLSASNMVPPDVKGADGPYGKDRPTRVLLLPAFQYIEDGTPNLVPGLIKSVINSAPTNTTPLPRSSDPSPNGTSSGTVTPTVPEDAATISIPSRIQPDSLPAGLSLRSCPHKYLILLCSHATRDARCGQSAPLLRKELERHLRPLGLYRDLDDERPGGVGIYFINHVGGHKYSANMMVYRRAYAPRSVGEQIANGGTDAAAVVGGVTGGEDDSEAGQCIWLARVRPEDCENIVRFTVLQGKVVKPDRQLRGGFNRETGAVSW